MLQGKLLNTLKKSVVLEKVIKANGRLGKYSIAKFNNGTSLAFQGWDLYNNENEIGKDKDLIIKSYKFIEVDGVVIKSTF